MVSEIGVFTYIIKLNSSGKLLEFLFNNYVNQCKKIYLENVYNDKLKRLLERGLTAIYSNTNGQKIARHTYVFLDNVLTGAQNKEGRQIFVLEKYAEALKALVFLGTEPTKSTVSKNLTRNALTTTDLYLFPVDMKQLTICILPRQRNTRNGSCRDDPSVSSYT
ncbi:hypothetical protein JOD82_003922 [Paenibacillus sp. 1182]|uniref:hypothetical protein n=1 Tax=Paenibacillus sp. 1182 TaxID=2806565 RepID=UPI000F993346|nr:hypothetical protein [Paenibacillus sp. 1182]MBP1310808.1 hypothetical protein [Paenibacillus sp. 1182]